MTTTAATGPQHRNEVLLVGTLQAAVRPRILSDGTEVVTFRLGVTRDPETGAGTDSLECNAAAARIRRAAAGWSPGDVLEVSGALRRNFYRAGPATRPFSVVEVDRARRLAPGVTRRRKSG